MLNWKPDQKKEIAKLAGIAPSFLSQILSRSRRANAMTAKRLEDACIRLSIPLTRFDWLYPEDSTNPLMQLPKSEKQNTNKETK